MLRTTQPGDSPTVKTYYELFPELNAAYAQPYDPPDKIAAIYLPDGRSYQLFYNVYGEVARVILPTGGALEYDWDGGIEGGYSSGVTCGTPGCNSEIYRKVIERRVYTDSSLGSLRSKTSYSKLPYTDGPSTVTVEQKDAGGSVLTRSKHYFYTNAAYQLLLSFGDPFYYNSWRDGKEYQTEEIDPDSGTVLCRSISGWAQRAPVSWWVWSPDLEPPNDPRLTETVTTLLDVSPNLVTKQSFNYDQYNNRTDVYEYDYGTGSPPAYATRHTHTDYLTTNPVNGANYATDNNIHLRSLPLRQIIYAVNPTSGQESWAAQTEYEYDRYDTSTHHAPLVNRTNISGLDSAFTTSYTTRGNVTQVRRWLNSSGSSTVTTYAQYNIADNVVKAIDGRGYATDFDFSDRYGAPDGEARANSAPAELGGQTSFAFATKVTNPLGHEVYTQFDYYLGRPVDVEDPNGSVTSTRYGTVENDPYVDLLDRPTQLIRGSNAGNPSKSQTTIKYDDASRLITTTSDRDSYQDNLLKSETLYDGLGRTTEKRQYESGTAYITIKTVYDALGRVFQVSNPYRSGESVFWTTTQYDALSREVSATTPDNAAVTTAYSGNRVLVTDQASRA